MPQPSTDAEGSEEYAFTPYLVEMHGNVRYMHCFDETKPCSLKFYKAPTLAEVSDRKNHVPKCRECGAPMKPHCMFFDESYNEKYYRDMTTRKMEEEIDAFIVIGTALATGGASSMVNRTLNKKEIPVIEFNMQPCIEEGYVFNVTEKCETALEKFFNEYYRLQAGGKPTVKPLAPPTQQASGAGKKISPLATPKQIAANPK